MVGVVKTSSDGALDVKSMKKYSSLTLRSMHVSLKKVPKSHAKLTTAGMPGFGFGSNVGNKLVSTTLDNV